MEFFFKIYNDRRYYRLKATVVYTSQQMEQIRVEGRDRSILLQSNRPLLRNKGLKQRRPTWKILEGRVANAAVLEKIITAIMENLDTGS